MAVLGPKLPIFRLSVLKLLLVVFLILIPGNKVVESLLLECSHVRSETLV